MPLDFIDQLSEQDRSIFSWQESVSSGFYFIRSSVLRKELDERFSLAKPNSEIPVISEFLTHPSKIHFKEITENE